MTAQQLKASILQLAIQGKLVPQNPADEPASVLLKRIKAEKDALVKAGKLKKDKHESVIIRSEDGRYLEKKDGKTTDITDEIPFDLPDTWQWVRLGLLFSIVSARRVHKADWKSSGIPFYRAREIAKLSAYGFVDNELFISYEQYDHFKKSSGVPSPNDIMVTAVGTIGKTYVVKEEDVFYYKDASVICLENHHGMNPYYFKYVFASPFIQTQLHTKSAGTTVDTIPIEKAEKYLFPLPPLEEQARIVAKIEELLPHIEEYGKAETELSKLNAELPEQLKKSILQWAIQGRLVPQDPTDEPASELLKRIKAEKAALIKSGKLKKEKPLSPISEDEIPFDIPESWEWIKLGDVCLVARGGSPRPIKDYITEEDNGINWIKIGDTDKGGKYINSTREKIKPSGVSKSRMVHAGDFLLTNSMSFGRPYILNVDGCIHDGWLVLSGYQTVYNKDFLFYMLSSAFAYQQFSGITGGSVVKNLNSDKVADTVFPLPPLAEQKRIVEKLETVLSVLETK